MAHSEVVRLGPYEAPGFYRAPVLDALRALPEKSVQAIVTSPLYWRKRGYDGTQSYLWDLGEGGCSRHDWRVTRMPITPGGLSVKKARVGSTRRGVQREIVEFSTCSICGAWKGALGTEVEVDDYIRHCLNVTAQLGAILRDDGVMFWNIADSYDPARPKSLVGVPERMTLALLRQGWIVRSSLVWSKPNPIPVTSNDRLYSAHEITIVATKRKRYKWNHQKEYRLDVWEIGHPRIEGGNSAVFPPELPRRCVLLATNPGDVVLDPFAGSGTTLAIADLLGRKGLGFDVSKRFIRDYPVREAAIRAWYDHEALEK